MQYDKNNNNFVHTASPLEVGKEYQYKEGGFICNVRLLEDNSTDQELNYELEILNGECKGDKFNMFAKLFVDGKPWTTSGMCHLHDLGAYFTKE